MSDYVHIFDTTLRDGEQSPGASMNLEEKLILARQLEKLNVDVIEAGFPISSDGDFEAVKRISQEVRTVTIAGLARASRGDIDRCWEAVQYASKPRIHTFIATSDIHLKYKLKKSEEEVLESAAKAVRHARGLCDDVEFSAEDASRTDLQFLCRVLEAAIEAGAGVVNIPDTVGYASPGEFGDCIQYIRAHVKNIDRAIISVHCHNDLGLAVANSLIAVQNGARQVECTINGIGERAGNASLEEIVMALKVRFDVFGLRTGVDTEEVYPSSQLLANLTGLMVQANKAIVGRNAFAHEAGIHQDGVIKEKSTYEIMRPESVGLKDSKLIMGKHSGRHALKLKYKELGFDLGSSELEKAYVLFKKVADQKKEVYDDDLIVIVRDGVQIFPEIYKLKYIQTNGGNQIQASASIALEREGQLHKDSAIGDGPVDATLNSIDRITNIRGRLLDYNVRSVTRGKDAVGEVFMKVKFGEMTFIGKAASTDIMDASARAYLNAVNKLLHYRMAVQEHQQEHQGGSVSAG